jgi:DNA-directed RNA polymerase specialized sigma24 family protein
MSDDPSTADLMTSAATGSKQAWDALVDRYAPLVWSICHTYRLGDAEADQVGKAVWTQLASQLGTIAGDAELASWLAASTVRECGAREPATAGPAVDPGAAEQELRAAAAQNAARNVAQNMAQNMARNMALREALSRLPRCHQQLITMLAADPPVPDSQISAVLGIPVDSIGPTRRRCLDQLRRDPAVAQMVRSRPVQ